MTNDSSNLITKQIYHSNENFFVSNGDALSISHIGDTVIQTGHKNLYLNDILVEPQLNKNLICVSKLTSDNTCSVEFTSFGFCDQGPKSTDNSQGL